MLDDYVRRGADTTMVDKYDTLSEREREVFELVAGRLGCAELKGVIEEIIGIAMQPAGPRDSVNALQPRASNE